jgi:hypothetical protein
MFVRLSDEYNSVRTGSGSDRVNRGVRTCSCNFVVRSSCSRLGAFNKYLKNAKLFIKHGQLKKRPFPLFILSVKLYRELDNVL